MASSGPPGSAVGKAETHELADFREMAAASRTSVSTTGHSQGSNASHVLQDTASSASTLHASSEEAGPADEAQVPEPSQLREVLICISAFVVIFTACGLNFAYGVYQALYEDMSQEPGNPFTGVSQSAIGLIGTLSVAFMQIGAPLASAWVKRFSPRVVLFSSGVLYLVACLSASYSTKLWHFMLTQGFLLGISSCLAFITAVTVTPTWYTKRRGLAMGIVLSGTGIGGLVWAPAIQAMNDRLGFRVALRINGAVAIAVLTASTFVLDWDDASKARLKRENTLAKRTLLADLFQIPLVNWRVARSKAFVAQAIGTTFHGMAYYIPLFFFSSYAQSLNYSAVAGANFIAINNACNALGKIVIGFLADRYLGRINTLALTTLVSAVGTAAFWIPSTLTRGIPESRGLFIAFSITYGTFASAYVSLFPASLVELFGPAQYASVNGLLYMLRGFGGLAGAPLGAALIRGSPGATRQHAYWTPSILTAGLLAAATAAVAWVLYEARKRPIEMRPFAKQKWRI